MPWPSKPRSETRHLRRMFVVLVTALLSVGLSLATVSSAQALPPGGPAPTGNGNVEIDDSHAYPGGYIKLKGTGFDEGAYPTGLSVKILWTPASTNGGGQWVQLNWTNPDGQLQAGRGGYTEVAQTDGVFKNDFIILTAKPKNGNWEATLRLPSALRPDLYYSQALESNPMVARGNFWQSTAGPAELSASLANAKPGEKVTLTARNFSNANTWNMKTFKKADPVPVTFKLGDTELGKVVPDSTGVATLTTTIPAGTAAGDTAFTATQRYRSDSVKVRIADGDESLDPEASIQAKSVYWGDNVDFIASRLTAGQTASFSLVNDSDQNQIQLGSTTVGSDGIAKLTAAIPDDLATGSYSLVVTSGGITVRSTISVGVGGASPQVTEVEEYCIDSNTLVANAGGNLSATGTNYTYAVYVFLAALAVATGVTVINLRKRRADKLHAAGIEAAEE